MKSLPPLDFSLEALHTSGVERLNLLSVALGLACLAGFNLYLTVFVTGLAIHLHWIALGSTYQSLGVLGDPVVLVISGILFGLEFFADKIPWIDSMWDAVHTVIRPIGGALLAVQVLGHTSPTFDVVIALLAGTTTLAAHTAKATTRLLSNTSPEPFSNIALSLGEDAAVVGGLALLHFHPVFALGLFAALILAFFVFAPRIVRAGKTKVSLVWQKLNQPAFFRANDDSLPLALPLKLAEVFSRENVLGETIAWAVPCYSGRGRRLPPNLSGALVATNEEPRKLTFVARRGARPFARTIDLDGMTIAREPKFLSENLVIFSGERRGPKYVFVFPRPRAHEVEKISESLQLAPEPAAVAMDPAAIS
ncbi:MAG: DUF4126 domain-containing protein [Verrucomicrobiota bacterium]